MMHEKPKLSAWEYATLLGPLLWTLFIVCETALTAGIQGRDGPPTFKKRVLYKALRTFTSMLSIRQQQALTPTTIDAYRNFGRRKNLGNLVAVDIGDDSVGCWIGDKDEAETTLVWFHGGGYVSMATAAHFQLLYEFVEKSAAKGVKAAGFLLQYDTAPNSPYPRQLIQAVTALEYLTTTVGKSQSQLILVGDSAGANLVLGLISHLRYPHEKVPVLEKSNEQFKGVGLISPWVTFSHDAPSFIRNAEKDCLSVPSLKDWSNAFLGGEIEDYYNAPLNAPEDWWQEIHADRILITGGGDEVFVDDIQSFAKKLQNCDKSHLDVFIAPGECHDAPVVEQLGRFGPGEQTKVLQQWLLDLVQTTR